MNFSPLDFNQSPLLPLEKLKDWGRTLAVAPHPDDESLGCGGTLALLAKARVKTAVLWISDGAASHANSKAYAPPKLTNLREAEGKMALDKLGVGRRNSYFLRLPDGNVPFPDDERFEDAITEVRAILDVFEPQTLLLPWRRDPHRDHRATWQLLSYAVGEREINTFEYLVWAFERAEPHEWPQDTEASAFVLDISSVQKRKMSAVYSHASQTTRLIKDDPDGFWLSPEVISYFETPYEAWIAPFCSLPEVASRTKARPA